MLVTSGKGWILYTEHEESPYLEKRKRDWQIIVVCYNEALQLRDEGKCLKYLLTFLNDNYDIMTQRL